MMKTPLATMKKSLAQPSPMIDKRTPRKSQVMGWGGAGGGIGDEEAKIDREMGRIAVSGRQTGKCRLKIAEAVYRSMGHKEEAESDMSLAGAQQKGEIR